MKIRFPGKLVIEFPWDALLSQFSSWLVHLVLNSSNRSGEVEKLDKVRIVNDWWRGMLFTKNASSSLNAFLFIFLSLLDSHILYRNVSTFFFLILSFAELIFIVFLILALLITFKYRSTCSWQTSYFAVRVWKGTLAESIVCSRQR